MKEKLQVLFDRITKCKTSSITFGCGDSVTGVIPWLVLSVDLVSASLLGDEPINNSLLLIIAIFQKLIENNRLIANFD